MLLPVLVFFVGAGAVVGAYYAFTALPGYLAARQLDRRLRDVTLDMSGAASPADSKGKTVVKQKAEGPLPAKPSRQGPARKGLRRIPLMPDSAGIVPF